MPIDTYKGFKIGDRVICIDDTSSSLIRAGDEGTVVCFMVSNGNIGVEWDTYRCNARRAMHSLDGILRGYRPRGYYIPNRRIAVLNTAETEIEIKDLDLILTM